jgi:K+-sensing histidine kinase KdpD
MSARHHFQAQSSPQNIIRNAVKYTAPGTVVEIHATISADSTQLVVTVLDRGPGVPAPMLEKIFEPFTRVEGGESVRGVGLGLAIARRAMKLHGGRIEAELRTPQARGRDGVTSVATPSHPKIYDK